MRAASRSWAPSRARPTTGPRSRRRCCAARATPRRSRSASPTRSRRSRSTCASAARPRRSISPGARVVLAGGERLRFDGLVIATGATPRRLPATPPLAGILVLRTLDDCLRLRGELEQGPRVAVVGAGFIGAEVAASCRQRGLEVTLLETLPAPARDGRAARDRRDARRHPSRRRCHGPVWRARRGLHGRGARRGRRARRRRAHRRGRGGGRDRRHARDALARGLRTSARRRRRLRRDARGRRARRRRGGRRRALAQSAVRRDRCASSTGPTPSSRRAPRPNACSLVPAARGPSRRCPSCGPINTTARSRSPGAWARRTRCEIALGSLAERRFVALFGRAGRLVGALAMNRPRQLVACRKLIREGRALRRRRSQSCDVRLHRLDTGFDSWPHSVA